MKADITPFVTGCTWLGISSHLHSKASLTFLSIMNRFAAEVKLTWIIPLCSLSLCPDVTSLYLPADPLKACSEKVFNKETHIFNTYTYTLGLSLSMWSGSAVNPGVSPLPNPLCELAVTLKQTLASSIWPGFSWHVRTSLMELPGGLHHSWWFWSISTLTTPRQLVREQTNM